MSRHRNRRQATSRRRAALIGIAAILFQAILFGWHHHAVALPGSSGPIATLHSAAAPLAPATAEELCDICGVLHQQSAAPRDFVILMAPSPAAAPNDLPSPVAHDRIGTRGFDARAPPRL